MGKFQEEFYKILMRQGVVFIDETIEAETAAKFLAAIVWAEKTNQRSLRVLIRSNGGSFAAAQDIIDLIKNSKVPVEGVVVGYAFSSAAMIFVACHKRIMLPNSEILFHEVSGDPEFKSWIDLNTFNLKYLLYEKFGISFDDSEKIFKQGCLSAQMCKNLGIIDEVLVNNKQ